MLSVDGIVTASHARGRGLARRLYRELFEHAARAAHDRVVCEVNVIPPNPASDTFHADLDFIEVGTGAIHGGSKTVTYLSRAVDPERLQVGLVPDSARGSAG